MPLIAMKEENLVVLSGGQVDLPKAKWSNNLKKRGPNGLVANTPYLSIQDLLLIF